MDRKELTEKRDHHIKLARVARNKRNFAGEYNELHEALSYDPSSFAVRLNIVTALHHLGRREEAADGYESLYKENKLNATLLLNYGAFLAGNKQYDKAVALYEEHLLIKPESIEGRLNLSKALTAKKAYYRALEINQQLRRISPTCLEASINIANIKCLLGDLDDANQEFRIILKDNRKNKKAVIGFAGCLIMMCIRERNLRYWWQSIYWSANSLVFLSELDVTIPLFIAAILLPLKIITLFR